MAGHPGPVSELPPVRAAFDGFTEHDVEVGGTTVHAVVGGDGPPVLLLHGYPQTHVMWHAVAATLAEHHTVVAADLRGYGDSAKPHGDPEHETYGKRAMAADQVGLMRALGHERFAVVGHDRGARVAHRLCLDHPEAVTRAAVLDIAPTRHVLHHVDLTLARAYEHWFFLSQQGDLPERMIEPVAETYLRSKLAAWSADGVVFEQGAVGEYVRCFDAASIHATCEDYRAGVTSDLALDEASYDEGLRVGCPLLVLWGTEGLVGRAYDVLDVWRSYAASPDLVTGHALDCGHFLPEERPEETVRALLDFLG